MTVHLVQFGLVACMMEMPPAKWPEGHKWSSDLDQVTCAACKKGARETPPTFEIKLEKIAKGIERHIIVCRICGSSSFNPHDIAEHFCGWCKAYHDDIWPPARRALIGHPELVGAEPFQKKG
jgi:hypothetical protein